MYTENPTEFNNYTYSYWPEYQEGEVYLNNNIANYAIKENGRAIQPTGGYNIKNVSVEIELYFHHLDLPDALVIYLTLYQYKNNNLSPLENAQKTIQQPIRTATIFSFTLNNSVYTGFPLTFKVVCTQGFL
jgi:hypothetical protein